jgi:hypothetical protein
LLGALFVFFLFPRTVVMQRKGRMQTLHAYIPPKECPPEFRHVNITFQQVVRLINDNYVAAEVTSLECSIWYHRMFAGSTMYYNLHIPKRSQIEVRVYPGRAARVLP